HTRFSRDWSSDVCSSDLDGVQVSDVTDPYEGIAAQHDVAKRTPSDSCDESRKTGSEKVIVLVLHSQRSRNCKKECAKHFERVLKIHHGMRNCAKVLRNRSSTKNQCVCSLDFLIADSVTQTGKNFQCYIRTHFPEHLCRFVHA